MLKLNACLPVCLSVTTFRTSGWNKLFKTYTASVCSELRKRPCSRFSRKTSELRKKKLLFIEQHGVNNRLDRFVKVTCTFTWYPQRRDHRRGNGKRRLFQRLEYESCSSGHVVSETLRSGHCAKKPTAKMHPKNTVNKIKVCIKINEHITDCPCRLILKKVSHELWVHSIMSVILVSQAAIVMVNTFFNLCLQQFKITFLILMYVPWSSHQTVCQRPQLWGETENNLVKFCSCRLASQVLMSVDLPSESRQRSNFKDSW